MTQAMQTRTTGMGSGTLGGPAASNPGSRNTAAGSSALTYNTSGLDNSAFGVWALYSNTTGSYNTAVRVDALASNQTANGNTALGYLALNLSVGSGNTAAGSGALKLNTEGNQNTASGNDALANNTTGSDNSASGFRALYSNTTADYNTAAGYEALYYNSSGNYNNASGYFALFDNTAGSQNSAFGVQALFGNKTGNYNTASGTDALFSNTTGSTNIAAGYKAGYNLTTGSNNIDIGNLGVAAESGTIRIGTTSTQTKTFIAGIYGTSVTGSTVVVSSTGQLGVTVSSERYKTAIAPMGLDTAKLDKLRPVTFKLKTDATGTRQYGLIAEEVARVYPELVIRDEKGRIDGVRYDELAPTLLNEAQREQSKNAAQEMRIRDLERQVAQMHAELLKLHQDDRVARR
jgi:hypothetical protein